MFRISFVILAMASALALNGCSQCTNTEDAAPTAPAEEAAPMEGAEEAAPMEGDTMGEAPVEEATPAVEEAPAAE